MNQELNMHNHHTRSFKTQSKLVLESNVNHKQSTKKELEVKALLYSCRNSGLGGRGRAGKPFEKALFLRRERDPSPPLPRTPLIQTLPPSIPLVGDIKSRLSECLSLCVLLPFGHLFFTKKMSFWGPRCSTFKIV